MEQRSILDVVLEDARAKQRRVGVTDREKLDQYLTSVRDIEKRIEQSERFGEIKDPDMQTPAGVPTIPFVVSATIPDQDGAGMSG